MHTPVLLKEVIQLLAPTLGEFFIDGTLGGGGHAIEIIKRIEPDGTFLGVDLNHEAMLSAEARIAEEKFNSEIVLCEENYTRIPELLGEKKLGRAKGFFLDLGFSSSELESSGKGFSFQRDEPLDMRYATEGISAEEVVNSFSEKELADIFKTYGEERFSNSIARIIIETRNKKPIRQTFDLVSLVLRAMPGKYRNGRLHPATRVFQALRIYVNHELENIQNILRALPDIMDSGGRVAIISFHSLEDRLVKNAFRDFARDARAELLTKKPMVASEEERSHNPRSRSAKLRAIQFI